MTDFFLILSHFKRSYQLPVCIKQKVATLKEV